MSTFVSYAQNFEDVILKRVLADVDHGFYIDVGAQHPIHDSVTRAFYERGWRGVNIEPVDEWYGLLCIDRPEDTNLQVVLGESHGEVTFYRVTNTGLSTMDAQVANVHLANGEEVVEVAVPMRTLADVIEQVSPDQLHFLKIDVEGAEGEVLRGLDLSLARPWILVVESTQPNTQVDVSHEWSHLIIDAGYSEVYFDGLNRFYLADEHAELTERFAMPPNCFDDFVRYADWERGEQARKLAIGLSDAQGVADVLKAQLRDLKSQVTVDAAEIANQRGLLSKASESLRESERVAHYWWHTAEEMRSEIALMRSSRSWRWTAPMRMRGKDGAKFLVLAIRRRVGGVLVRAIRYVLIRPAVKKIAIAMLRLHPGFLMRLKRFAVRSGLAVDMGPSSVSVDGIPSNTLKREQLSPRGNRILVKLEQALAEKKH
jgi:FkbM family methyltransferase